MTFLKTSIALVSILLISCCSTTKTTSNTSEDKLTTTEMDKKINTMIDAGFSMAEVIESKTEGDCPFTLRIIDKDAPYLLDPINMTDQFKKNGKKVWVKYAGLRMMNRCEKANPVNIIEIEKRVE
jgi:hypothetical protein